MQTTIWHPLRIEQQNLHRAGGQQARGLCPLVSASAWLNIWASRIPSLHGSKYFRLVFSTRGRKEGSFPTVFFPARWHVVVAAGQRHMRIVGPIQSGSEHINKTSCTQPMLFQRNQSTPTLERTRLSTSEIYTS